MKILKTKFKGLLIFKSKNFNDNRGYFREIAHQKNINEKFNSVCLIGHEPNFSSFISRSCNEKHHRFPTASMAKIVYNKDKWINVKFGLGKLEWIKRPKEL